MRRTVLTIGSALCASVAGAQDVVYYDSNGFEAPTYQLGPIAAENIGSGQDSWLGITDAMSPPFFPNFDRLVVQADRVHDGVAALKFDASGHPQHSSIRIELHRGTFHTMQHRWMRLDADLYWQSGSANSGRWVLTCQQLPVFPLTSLIMYPDGHMTGDDWVLGSSVPLGATFDRDTWNHVRFWVDYQQQTVAFELNGVSIGTVGFPSVGEFGLIGFFLYDRGDDAMFADNLKAIDTDSGPCYADCNADGALTVADFGCFQTRFVVGDPYADCNGDGQTTVADFGCFQTRFVAGCP